jgi:hypothetical protein
MEEIYVIEDEMALMGAGVEVVEMAAESAASECLKISRERTGTSEVD